METMPLFFYPSTLALVSDDEHYLNTITYLANKKNIALAVRSSTEAIQILTNYKSYLAHKNFFPHASKNSNLGKSQTTPISFDITMIAEMMNDLNRHQEISVIVIDLEISEIKIIELARACTHLPIRKILLAEFEKIDMKSLELNDNPLDRLICKSDKSLNDTFLYYIDELTLSYFREMTRPLLKHLESEHLTPLSDPAFIHFFTEYCLKNDVIEYYLIHTLGSFLCIDKHGYQFFFVMHTDHSIERWLTLNGNVKNELINDVNARKKIPFFGLKKDAWQTPINEWEEYSYPANLLEGRERYYWSSTKKEEQANQEPLPIFELCE